MNKKLKLFTLTSFTAVSVATPLITTLSCGSYDSSQRLKIAVSSAPTMNFISHTVSAGVIAPSVMPLIESMPSASIKNKYQLLPLKMLDLSGGSMQHPNFTYAAMNPSTDGSTYELDATGRKITIEIRNYMKWENGDKLVAQNYVDTIKAMLDLNNASEYEYEIERLGFENAAESYKAQTDFFARNGFVYKDPFNYGDKNNGEPLPFAPDDFVIPAGKTRDQAEMAAGYFPTSLRICTQLGVYAQDDYHIVFRFNHKESLNFLLNVTSPVFWPINRKFIMETGGFDKFGTDADHVLASGAYKVDTFDSKYGVEFSQNPNYYNKNRVITPYIDFTFISNTQTLGALYQDGRLLSTPVGIDFLPKYLSDEDLRSQTKRGAGIGTLSLFLNRYDNNHHNELFDDVNFRKALFYGIDRKQLLSALHLDFSNPVAVYTAAGSTSPDGELYLETLSNRHYDLNVPTSQMGSLSPETKASLSDRNFMISPAETRMWMYNYDNLDREDTEFNPEIARAFMAEAKRLHPGSFPVTLDYPYNSSDPVGKSLSIVLAGYLHQVFGNDIKLNAMPLPVLVYQDKISHGQWDIQIKQVDPATSRPWDYLGEFVNKDVPDAAAGKSTGYIRNNSGGATYQDYFAELSKSQEDDFKRRYDINDFDYMVTKWFITQELIQTDVSGTNEFGNNILRNEILASPSDPLYVAGKVGWWPSTQQVPNPNYDALNTYQKQLVSLLQDFSGGQLALLLPQFDSARKEYNNPLNSEMYHNNSKANEIAQSFLDAKTRFMESSIPYNVAFKTVYPVLDCLIRDMVPVIPLVEADNRWSASRAMGASPSSRGHWANPEYLYDGLNKPYAWLDTLGAK